MRGENDKSPHILFNSRPFAYKDAFIADKTVLNHNHEYKYDLHWA